MVPPAAIRPHSSLLAKNELGAERRDIDPVTLRAAQAAVTSAVPDPVLADALQNTDARQPAQAFAHVDASVLAAATGHTPAMSEAHQARPEHLRPLAGAEKAVDDLDIWKFDT